LAAKGCDVEAGILTGEVVPFRVTELGGESGKSCDIGRVINDLRGANNGVEAGLVGESGGLIDVLVERSLGGAIVAEVDGLAGLADRVDAPDALEEGPLLKELARRRPLVLGVRWCPGAGRVANGGLYAQYEQI
jgi:hypothetical protein